ncbi:MAG TPA: twin-arginine translocase subunit TatC [Candidatus Polarisedimenticolaceae bacterium]|nr:twin-arginine translocase subunit TatC [Candidatus Polarisedimenticolaceae bacterium]
MSLLDHLDELRSRLFRSAVAFLVVFALCWWASSPILRFLLRPLREHLTGGGEIVFIYVTEAFMVYTKAAALAAVFAAAPYILYQFWAFVAPGLHRREQRMVLPAVVFASLFFILGGAFGYYVALPQAAHWLIDLGAEDFKPTITLRSAFQFEATVILGMGAVFELPIVIFFLARIGVVTPRFLMKHFRAAVVIIAVLAAVITPTGDMVTMSVFAGPMVALYLLGTLVAWLFERRSRDG